MLRDQECGLLLGERREADRRGVELAAAPVRAAARGARVARCTTTRSGTSAHPVDELVDEVEQALVGPVQVLEHEDERPLLGERLEEAPPGGEGLAAAVSSEPGLGLESDERTKMRLDPAGVAGVLDGVLDGRVQLLGRVRLGVSLGDPRLRLHDLARAPRT